MDLNVNKLTAAVNSASSAADNDLNEDGHDHPICENPEHSENSETGEVDSLN